MIRSYSCVIVPPFETMEKKSVTPATWDTPTRQHFTENQVYQPFDALKEGLPLQALAHCPGRWRGPSAVGMVRQIIAVVLLWFWNTCKASVLWLAALLCSWADWGQQLCGIGCHKHLRIGLWLARRLAWNLTSRWGGFRLVGHVRLFREDYRVRHV